MKEVFIGSTIALIAALLFASVLGSQLPAGVDTSIKSAPAKLKH